MVALLSLLLAALPTIETPVVDPDDYLSSAEEEGVAELLVELREATGVQMAVVILRSTGGEPIEDAAQRMFDAWGGGSSERDDGALFVLAIGDRRSRLHLGYGLEPFIQDSVAKRILDDQRPLLKAGDYATASRVVVSRVALRVASLKPGARIEIPLGMQFPGALLIVFILGLIGGFAWAYRGVGPNTTNRLVDGGADLAISRDPGENHWLVPVLAWLAGPLAVAGVFHAGRGFWSAYAMVYLSAAIFATLLVWCHRKIDGPLATIWGVLGLIAVPVAIGIAFSPQVATGNEVQGELLKLLMCVGAAGIAAVVLRGVAAIESSGVSGGSSGWSSSSSSSSSSSWSSSSSSSSWSSSSSSSSTSWGGGGGSSGGGGASSSW